MPLWPGSRTVTLIPSCGNSIGGSPYSLANQHAAPLVSEENHSASRTLTTNQPSVTGASPEPASSSLASFTQQILAVQRRVSGMGERAYVRGAWQRSNQNDGERRNRRSRTAASRWQQSVARMARISVRSGSLNRSVAFRIRLNDAV